MNLKDFIEILVLEGYRYVSKFQLEVVSDLDFLIRNFFFFMGLSSQSQLVVVIGIVRVCEVLWGVVGM